MNNKPHTRKQRLRHRRLTLQRRLRAAYWFHRVHTANPTHARRHLSQLMNPYV